MDEDVRKQIAETYELFRPVRARFRDPGVERGGHERPGVVPIYLKKYGEYASLIYPDIEAFTVESSFSEQQLQLVNRALLALKEGVLGKPAGVPLGQRVVSHYLGDARPYFMLAMLRAVEDTIREVVERAPQLVAVLEAIFSVAGSEGMRDLVRIYCAHMLEHALKQAQSPMPDIYAFVDLHDRERYDAAGALHRSKFEVWCPGTDLAKEIFRQCEQAARALTKDHGVSFALSIQEEVAMLPGEVSSHLTRFVQQTITPALKACGVA